MTYIGNKIVSIISNASGCWASTEDQMDAMLAASHGHLLSITTKTATLDSRDGHVPPTISNDDVFCINAVGLKNLGYLYYRNLFPKYYASGITYILSIDASNLTDMLAMLEDYDEYVGKYSNNCELVEINISCPNITSNGHRIVAYDIDAIRTRCIAILKLELRNLHIGFKIPPFIDHFQLDSLVSLFNKIHRMSGGNLIKYVCACNSIPNGFYEKQPGTAIPAVSRTWGGISGLPARLLAMGTIAKLKGLLNPSISIVACGGIETLEHVATYLALGAKSVQVGRHLLACDFTIFKCENMAKL